MITYRKAAPEDVRPALELALRVFMEFEAPEYEPEAIDKFKADIVYNEQFIKNWENGVSSMYVALDGDMVVGVIGEKWNNGHINIVFVDGEYHRRGIATALMNYMVCDLKLRGFDKITLFSSPYGIPLYLEYGFITTGAEQHSDGFIFTPMEYTPNEIWDVLDAYGSKTGRVVERGRSMYGGEYHLAVHIWIRNRKGEWLISKRSPEKKTSPNLWEVCGGAAVAGEDSLTAALREAKEELGLTLDPDKGRFVKTVVHENRHPPGGSCMAEVWTFSHDCPIEDIILQPGETCDAMWATAGQIRRMIKSGMFLGNDDKIFEVL